MSIIDLECQNSVSFSENCCCMDLPKDCLQLGEEHRIYLYFQLPFHMCSKILKQAKLILYKIPVKPSDWNPSAQSSRYCVYPLLDFFSDYSCCFQPPQYDYTQKTIFEDEVCSSYSEADITDIALSWINSETENKGLLLKGQGNSRRITYASNTYCTKGMRPMLRLIFDDTQTALYL